jgi:hypothetical protein
MKVKVSELQGAALDWAVAKCKGMVLKFFHDLSFDERNTPLNPINQLGTRWADY